jgi:hypothetical protein
MGETILIFWEYHNYHNAALTHLCRHLATFTTAPQIQLLSAILLSVSVSEGMATMIGYLVFDKYRQVSC